MSSKAAVSCAALGLLALCAGVATAQDGKVRLALSLQEGQSYRMKVVMEQLIKQTVMGSEMEVGQTIEIVHRFDVREVDPAGVALVGWVQESMRMTQESPGGRVEYDSSDTTNAADPMTRTYDAMVGKEFSARIAPTGKVTDVHGMDEMLDEMLADMDTALAAQLREQLGKQLGDEAMADMLTSSLGFYPAEPVGVGDSWTRSFRIATVVPMITETTWTLKERRDGVAVIDVESTVGSDPDAPPLQMGAFAMKMTLSGQQSGTIEVDESSGWIVHGVINQEFSGESSLSGAQEMNQTWPIKISGTVTTESL